MKYLPICLLLGCGAAQQPPAQQFPVQQSRQQLRARPAQPVRRAPPVRRQHVFAPPPARIDVGPRRGAAPPATRVSTGVIDIEASWYGDRYHGRKTASGERFDMHAMTAAHKTLPFGTWVRVTHPQTGQTVEVRINDRNAKSDEIDLSKGAAEALGIIRAGRLRVGMEVLD